MRHQENVMITDNVNRYTWRTVTFKVQEQNLCSACADIVQNSVHILAQFRAIRISSSHVCDRCGAITADYYNTHLSG